MTKITAKPYVNGTAKLPYQKNFASNTAVSWSVTKGTVSVTINGGSPVNYSAGGAQSSDSNPKTKSIDIQRVSAGKIEVTVNF